MRSGCPKIGSLRWWPGVVIRFSLGLLSPDRTLRGGDSQKMEAGKVILQGSLPHAQSLPRGGGWGSGVRAWRAGKVCCGVGPASSCAGKCPTPPHASPGPSQLGQRDPGPGSSRRQVASSSASINTEVREPRAAELRQRERVPSVPSGGSRPAAAARACGSPRGALPRQLRPPRPGLQEPRPAALRGAAMSHLPDRERAPDGNDSRGLTSRCRWIRGPGGGLFPRKAAGVGVKSTSSWSFASFPALLGVLFRIQNETSSLC